MAELVDAPDSKSSDSNIVRVRFPLRPPHQYLLAAFGNLASRDSLFAHHTNTTETTLRGRFFVSPVLKYRYENCFLYGCVSGS